MKQRILLGIATMALAATLSSCIFGGGGGPVRTEGQPTATHSALISTTMGDIEVELYGEDAPKTVANFVGLADKGYYNGILFHRVARGFVIQAGDPKTKDESKRSEWGSGGESIYGETFEDELNPATLSYQRGYVEGTLAMANRGPNTNSSQFFIMLSDSQLNKAYSIFGKVTKGMDVVHAIENVELSGESGMGGTPSTPVAIKSIKTRTF